MKPWRPLTWLLLSLACLLGALYFWRLGDDIRLAKAIVPVRAGSTAKRPGWGPGAAHQKTVPAAAAPLAVLNSGKSSPSTNALSTAKSSRPGWLKYQLNNSGKTIGQLTRSPRAILLQNALIDTSKPLNFSIPADLLSHGDPGAYVVQARGPIDDAFRAALKDAGAEIISYIPNNSYLVRASSVVAQSLGAGPAQSVLPFEPYYKLSPSLLQMAVEQQPLPVDAELNMVVYPDALDATKASLQQLGVSVVRQMPSPFGPVLTIQPGPGNLAAIASLPGVGPVERTSTRSSANDLSRARVGVAADSVTQVNYLNLSGSNVVVQVNDSGVDGTHPDFAGRLFSSFPGALTDTDGHGTHVAGTIAGSGIESITVTNALGSVMPATNGQFRGMAPAAMLFVEPLLFSSLETYLTDFQLQEAAALTNALISNNSWNFSDTDYDIEAASYDAAVRDALPEVTGSQPVLFVFAAGNNGNGGDDGSGDSPGSILSPATAKNVITVGALEQPRGITNDVVVQGQTNQPWAGMTDSDSEVASFSSRGNVGVGIEGDNGRFKPDVVAPGVFVVSTRSQQWDQNAYYNPTNYNFNTFVDQVDAQQMQDYGIFLPYNTVQMLLINAFAIDQGLGLNLPIYVKRSGLTATNSYDFLGTNQIVISGPELTPVNSTWFYGIQNPTNVTIEYQVTTEYLTTNDNGNELTVLSNLNASIGPWYRYESGTSMAAADVSGVLALMEDFFTNTLSTIPSPALLKAMLINGARSANAIYDLQVADPLNSQGWGVVNLPNSIPSNLVLSNATVTWTILTNGPSPILLYEQSPQNALATGDSHTFLISVDPSAQNDPLRFTLVWTDPPGNPAASIKLVNNLDLVVTNTDSADPGFGDIYFGNDIPSGSTFNSPWDTNSPPNLDVINNVENVYLQPPLSSQYSITVIGREVNVNAVTAHPNDVVQDYALVVSSDSQSVNALTALPGGGTVSATDPNVTVMTNEFVSVTNTSGELLLGQHAGANTPFFGTNTIPLVNTIWGTDGAITLGMTNQWHFYTITNSSDPTFTNAAFVTFEPEDLAPSRMGVTNELDPDYASRADPDIDLYVSTDPGLTNLTTAAVAGAYKSLGRGGTEVIVLSNAAPNQVYYIGVKSEDQQAVEYGFFGVFSQQPFSQTDQNGIETVRGINVPSNIPDGSPANPGITRVMGIAVQPILIRRTVVTNVIVHQNFGDLLGSLSHSHQVSILENHSFPPGNPPPGTNVFIYDDSGEGGITGSQHTDGPGSLNNFTGLQGAGLWILTESDNALGNTGQVQNLQIRLYPEEFGNGIELTIEPNSFAYDFIDVPPQATNLVINVRNDSAQPLPLQLYVKRGAEPTQTDYDYTVGLSPGGGSLAISTADLPPLQPGTYYVGIFNPNTIPQTVFLSWILDLSFAPIQTVNFTSGAPAPILDDAVSYSSINVTGDLGNVEIAQASIGVAINHPRVSDLVLTLISPVGQRLVLMENRGGPNAANIGSVITLTNISGTVTAGGPSADTKIISGLPASGVLLINYNFYTEPDTIDVYYQGADVLSPGLTSGAGQYFVPFNGPAGTNITIIMNQGGNSDSNTLWTYTPDIISQAFSYFTFTDDTNFATVPIKFTIPPFFSSPSTSSIVVSDFEQPVAAIVYSAPSNAVPTLVDGWSVDSGQVRVLPAGGHSGNQYLRMLLNGSISRVLPTVPGDQYTLSFVYNGAGSGTVTIPGINTTNIAGNGTWQSNTLTFVAGVSGTPLQITDVTPGLWLDSFVLADVSSGNLYAQPEEPLQPLVGDSPLGTWTLEVRDDRAGASGGTPPPEIVSWQMQFIFATNTPSLSRLSDGITVTDNIPSCGLVYFAVDVPYEAVYATNVLVSATAPVNVWFNQDIPPVGTNPPDFELIANSTAGSATLSTNGIPPLIPGQRYFIGVQNPCSNGSNVTVALRVDFGAVGIIELTNMVPYTNVNSGIVNLSSDYYHFYVPPGAARAQFEIDNPSGNMALAVREGLPLPDILSYDYLSANPGLNDQLIVVFTNSAPVPLTPGSWYLTAINNSGGPVSYTIEASWWPTTGQPISITGGQITGTSPNQTFCITWASLPGVHYFIDAVTNLGPGMAWTTIVQDVVGDPSPATTTTYCIPLPSPYRFFRIGEGLVLNASPPSVSVSRVGGDFLLQWIGPVFAQYQVQWTSTFSPPNWQTVPTTITSTTGQFSFLDDGTMTGGLGGNKFYRVVVLP